MTSQPNVEKLICETRRYEFADGLRDFQVAIVWLAIGVTSWLVFDLTAAWFPFFIRLANAVGNWARWISMLLAFLPALLGIAALALTTYVRQRWLWRKSGWVKPLRRAAPPRATVISGAIWLAGVLGSLGLLRLGLVDGLFVLRMLVVGTSWSTGYFLVELGWSLGLSRYVWLGMIGGLIPTPLLFLPLTFGQVWLVLGLWWGLTLAASGTFALRQKLLSIWEANNGG